MLQPCTTAATTQSGLGARSAPLGVIDGELCRRLTRAQDARTMIEHGYIETSAGRVHQTAQLVRESARDFISRYRRWVEPYLDDSTAQKP